MRKKGGTKLGPRYFGGGFLCGWGRCLVEGGTFFLKRQKKSSNIKRACLVKKFLKYPTNLQIIEAKFLTFKYMYFIFM